MACPSASSGMRCLVRAAPGIRHSLFLTRHSIYAPIVALAVSLHGPVSPWVDSQRLSRPNVGDSTRPSSFGKARQPRRAIRVPALPGRTSRIGSCRPRMHLRMPVNACGMSRARPGVSPSRSSPSLSVPTGSLAQIMTSLAHPRRSWNYPRMSWNNPRMSWNDPRISWNKLRMSWDYPRMCGAGPCFPPPIPRSLNP